MSKRIITFYFYVTGLNLRPQLKICYLMNRKSDDIEDSQ